MFVYFTDSPVGIIRLLSDGENITGLHFLDGENEPGAGRVPDVIERCAEELREYFCGKRKNFGVKTKNAGAAFSERCWRELLNIPYGETRTYSYIAEKIGNPKAVRAVGSANSRNNISIIYPCHRVIGKNGRLTGYAGGLWRKEWLLNHEKRFNP